MPKEKDFDLEAVGSNILDATTKDLLPKIDSLLKWEVINFFHNNPSTFGTIIDLARYLGRSPEDLEIAVKDLVRERILVSWGEIWGNVEWSRYTNFYGYTNEEIIRKNIGKLVYLARKHGKRFERVVLGKILPKID